MPDEVNYGDKYRLRPTFYDIFYYGIIHAREREIDGNSRWSAMIMETASTAFVSLASAVWLHNGVLRDPTMLHQEHAASEIAALELSDG